uniref:Uncharacterized protein n=1 Tax=Glossina palpalis gambiensis TaxID=67801 RepID=A0A1B0ATA8_9MUSC
MRLTNILYKKVKAKRILVVVESMVSGHKFNTVRERLGDKVETIRFDPYIQKEAVYRELKKIRTLSYLFADDICLVYSTDAGDLGVLEWNINYSFEQFVEWSQINALLINSSKSKVMRFEIMSRYAPQINVLFGHSNIELVGLRKCLVVKYRLAYALLLLQSLYGVEVVAGTTAHIFSRLSRILHFVVRYDYNIHGWAHTEHVERFLGSIRIVSSLIALLRGY